MNDSDEGNRTSFNDLSGTCSEYDEFSFIIEGVLIPIFAVAGIFGELVPPWDLML